MVDTVTGDVRRLAALRLHHQIAAETGQPVPDYTAATLATTQALHARGMSSLAAHNAYLRAVAGHPYDANLATLWAQEMLAALA